MVPTKYAPPCSHAGFAAQQGAYVRWCEIWKTGHSISCCFFPSWLAFSASFILLENSRRVSSMSPKPSGGALRPLDERIAGMIASCGIYGTVEIENSYGCLAELQAFTGRRGNPELHT